jgi:tetratricopeptide (TPR) repeat protein
MTGQSDPDPGDEPPPSQAAKIFVAKYGSVAAETIQHLHQYLACPETPGPVRPSHRALSQLPPRVPGFTGREADLDAVLQALDPSRQSDVVAVVVAGLPGVGKTALAIEAGHAALERGWFPGGVIFLDPTSLRQAEAMDWVLRALGASTEQVPSGTEQQAAWYRSVLADTDQSVLIIADDAVSAEQVRPLLPGVTRHRILVTSRNTLDQLGARQIGLHQLTVQDALALLDTALRLRDPGDSRIAENENEAILLARRCGYLPLALQIAAALLARLATRQVAELAAELADARTRLDRLDDGERGMKAVFGLSYERLGVGYRKTLCLLAVSPGPDLATSTAAVLIGQDDSQARSILTELARAHLIESTGRERWRIHGLLRLYIAERAELELGHKLPGQALDRLVNHFMEVIAEATGYPGKPEATSEEGMAWIDAEWPSLLAVIRRAVAKGRDLEVLCLCLGLTEYLNMRGYLGDLLEISAISVNAARRLGDRGLPGAALNSRYLLGAALSVRSLGLQTARRFEEALAVAQEADGIFQETGDCDGQCLALLARGNILASTRRFDEAIQVFQRASDLLPESPEYDWLRAAALTGLGSALVQAGRPGEAISACQRAADLLAEAGSHLAVMPIGIVGLALAKMKQFKRAVAMCQRAVDMARESGNRIWEAISVGNLSRILGEAGLFAEAIAVCQECINIWLELGDRYHQGFAEENLGYALAWVRRFDEAIAAYERAIDIFGELGDRHEEAEALGNLAAVLSNAKRLPESITAYQKAGVVARGAGDPGQEAKALQDCGDAMQEARRFDEAIAPYLRAAALFREARDRRRLGNVIETLSDAISRAERFEATTIAVEISESDGNRASGQVDESVALDILGVALRRLGRFSDAAAAHEQAISIFAAKRDFTGKGLALIGLGDVLLAQERFDQALDIYEQAVSLFRAAADRSREGIALDRLGQAMFKAQRLSESAAAYQRAVGIFAENGDHQDQGLALTRLGHALWEQQRPGDAIVAFRDSVGCLRESGNHHAQAEALSYLGAALSTERRFREAARAFEDAKVLLGETGDSEMVARIRGLQIGIRVRRILPINHKRKEAKSATL